MPAAAQVLRRCPAGASPCRLPVKRTKVFDLPPRPTSQRAQAIAKSREAALFSCLQDLPDNDSDSELSLTDLVEDTSVLSCSPSPAKSPPKANTNKGKGGPRGDGAIYKGRETKRLRASSSGRGILLNVYLPVSLAQSPSSARRSGGSDGRDKVDLSKR